MSDDHHLTDKQKKFFWSCLFAWQERLGLTDWRITKSNKKPVGKVLCTMQDWDIPQRQVSCRLSPNWFNQEPLDSTIEKTAVHELLHVMLADLIEAARKPGATDEDLHAYEHAIINRLEKLLVPGEEGT
jgi:hypothetical protein